VLDVGSEVLDEHVGPGHELLEDLDPPGLLEVQADRALVAVQVLVVEPVVSEVGAVVAADGVLADDGAITG